MPLHRHAFFLGGFDPKSPAHYHRMYRDAAAKRPPSPLAERVEVSARAPDKRNAHGVCWNVNWYDNSPPDDALQARTRLSIFGWHDIVLRHWPRHLNQVLKDYACVYGTAWPDGTFAKLWRTSRPTFWLTQFPLLLGLACVLVCGGLAAGLGWVWGQPGAGALAGLGLGLVVWRRLARELDSEWMLRLLGFTYDQTHELLPELEQRIDEFADQLVAAGEQLRTEGGDELLLIGHSTGTMLAMSVMARALRKAPWLGTEGPALSLLTLGHSVPLLAFQPSSERFRRELALLSAHAPLCWIEYSAPADWAAFFHVPPWQGFPVQGLKRALSPRFHRILRPDYYRHLLQWRRRHDLHLQYLKAPDVAGGYDLVTLTAGPQTLAQQHAEAAPVSETTGSPS